MAQKNLELSSHYKPEGDQPKAIEALYRGIKTGVKHQTLLGVTGSGKTFTAANIIERINKPTLIIAHNKTLAAQLVQEYRDFFPNNAVHYFVSYYDYYQPEAYVPISDTYIEKEAQVNEEIDRLRHATTQDLLSRRDVIVVASVSAIYGLGSPDEYRKEHLEIKKGMKASRKEFLRLLVSLYFERTPADLTPGYFRVIGNVVEIMPVNVRQTFRVELDGDEVSRIVKIDPVSNTILEEVDIYYLFPAKHFVTNKERLEGAIKNIQAELKQRVKELQDMGKILEADRLVRRTKGDITLLREVGYCNGIENYSRHLSGKKKGEAPDTLLSYFPRNKDGSADFLTIIDESHVSIPQLAGMHVGDASRKKNLVEHGFRLPSALDNRPLKFYEFEERVGQRLYTSATPGAYERENTDPMHIVEQVIRPTGLLDPELVVCGVIEKGEYKGQIHDFIDKAVRVVKKGDRTMVTTLTKRMAEDLTTYLNEKGVKAEFVHSDVKTIERIKILTDFRRGVFDCLVGVNLLREGLDLPEVSLIGILDADKEGFLRSETSLIQTIGRAARNINGKVILYADKITGSMQRALDETQRRREIQEAYNKKHGITPQGIKKAINDITQQLESEHERALKTLLEVDRDLYKRAPKKLIKEKERQMNEAVKILDFETAALLRDEILALQEKS
ncbi:MAG: excinuclease ABC subunit UvrB [Candidatus Paceibacterota bacterium]